MPEYNLTDAQWCFLDLCMRAKARGIDRVNRMELLGSPGPSMDAKMQLTWAALIMPPSLVRLIGKHDFEITAEGAALYNLRFGNGQQKPQPTLVADAVIALPDLSRPN